MCLIFYISGISWLKLHNNYIDRINRYKSSDIVTFYKNPKYADVNENNTMFLVSWV